ncbi:MAG: cobyric acid synthase [Boseongicola sp.]|nr:cobyric acid synthase [Boseongicola sp.]NNJ67718.1 cobyric acid synthase [Boseongicola sp.]
MARALMVQGTGSNVGKSVIVAGLCRAASNRGLNVRPFKPQNMSNNAAVTEDGGEIGRAQALQARACRVPAAIHMNPVLLKPESDTGCQVVVQGHMRGPLLARDFGGARDDLMPAVLESFAQVREGADLVLVEGAGSPAEINLRKGDIANMGFATAANVPVVLLGDIDRGGVIAQIVGTQAVLGASDLSMVRGFLINKFRGDVGLFEDGYRAIEKRTGWRGFGVIPWFEDIGKLPAEDAVEIRQTSREGGFHIACPMLSRIANFDDLDPLIAEPGVRLTMIPPGQPLPGDADLVILPGTKSTLGDLSFLRRQGWDVDLKAHVRRGGAVLGVCGGYQMLGRSVHDPKGLDGPPGSVDGLGFLDIETTMTPEKSLTQVQATHVATGEVVSGYEIHIGRTHGADVARPFTTIEGINEGATSADGRIAGTYLHGLFAEDGFRRAFLATQGVAAGGMSYNAEVDHALDRLADHLEAHVNIDELLSIAS